MTCDKCNDTLYRPLGNGVLPCRECGPGRARIELVHQHKLRYSARYRAEHEAREAREAAKDVATHASRARQAEDWRYGTDGR